MMMMNVVKSRRLGRWLSDFAKIYMHVHGKSQNRPRDKSREQPAERAASSSNAALIVTFASF